LLCGGGRKVLICMYGRCETTIEQINNTTGTVLYLHHDQQGSTRLLTGSTGTVTGKCTYGAYGAPTCEGTATTPLGYDAQYTSSDTGLIYMRARVYDPSTAQFLSVDPLKATTGAPYYYAGDNPLNEADPTGLGNWLNLGIPSPGEVAEKLNPVKYYEEEIESYENGCGYFASVAHGLEGAVVGTLDASGIGGLAEGAAGLAGEEGSTAIEDALAHTAPQRAHPAHADRRRARFLGTYPRSCAATRGGSGAGGRCRGLMGPSIREAVSTLDSRG
jgi:RHS repeat-associated protein